MGWLLEQVPLWFALLVGVGLAVVLVGLILGAGMVAWRMTLDSGLGHAWRDDLRATVERWRSRWTSR